MVNLILKHKIILGIILVTLALAIPLKNRLLPNPSPPAPSKTQSLTPTDQEVRIVSTKPDPLEEAIVSTSETIEFTFNKPLENEGEFKIRLEPKIEYKIQLTQDRKTAKIIPLKPYALGSTYTLFIGPDTKFDGIGNWGQEKIFHFKTIRYRGV